MVSRLSRPAAPSAACIIQVSDNTIARSFSRGNRELSAKHSHRALQHRNRLSPDASFPISLVLPGCVFFDCVECRKVGREYELLPGVVSARVHHGGARIVAPPANKRFVSESFSCRPGSTNRGVRSVGLQLEGDRTRAERVSRSIRLCWLVWRPASFIGRCSCADSRWQTRAGLGPLRTYSAWRFGQLSAGQLGAAC